MNRHELKIKGIRNKTLLKLVSALVHIRKPAPPPEPYGKWFDTGQDFANWLYKELTLQDTALALKLATNRTHSRRTEQDYHNALKLIATYFY